MSFFNIDAFIVNKNIQGFSDRDRKQIDNKYLTVISLDAINEMNRAYKDGKIDSRTYLN